MSNHPINKLKSSPEDFFEPGLDLEPSEQVWKGIQAQLPKKRKRRILVFWIFAGLILLGGAATGLWLPIPSKPISAIQNSDYKMDSSSKVGESKLVSSSAQLSATHDKQITAFSAKNELASSRQHNKKITSSSNGLDFKRTESDHNNNLSTPTTNQNSNSHQSDSQYPTLSYSAEEEQTVIDLPFIETLSNTSISLKEKPFCHLLLTPAKIKVSDNRLKAWIGLHWGVSPIDQNKNIALTEPLSELIVGSYYNQWQNYGMDVYLPITSQWSAILKPSLIRESLVTDYDLSIPYDFNSEKHFGTYNENYFSHSLPTDLGNIKTNLVVTRSSDSPVEHNELISLDFRSKQNLTYLSLPLGLAFGNGQKAKGFVASFTFVPEYLIDREVTVDFVHSNHTFVAPKEVNLSSEIAKSNWHLGLGLNVEYRLPVYRNWSLQIQGNYNHYLTQSGRSQLYRVHLGVGRSF